MTIEVDLLLADCRLAGTAPEVEGTALGIRSGEIVHVGGGDEVDARRTLSLDGRLVTPGLVDCHTHLVFGGSRVAEFRRRVAGATYEEIAASGGGIVSTVGATRETREAELFAGARTRAGWLMRSGVTTVEIKSGYGLDTATELSMLRVARRLGAETPLDVHATLLAAHVVPPEFRDDPDGYVDVVCEEILPAAVSAGLVDSVDVFCERIAFTPAQTARILTAAASAGLPVRVHADQLSDGGGAALAAEHGALSADHLEHAGREGLDAMAAAGTVAVLIPGASTYLDESRRPPVEEMRAAGVAMAVATDLNPGTSPLASLPLAMSLACTRFGLGVDEALTGATRHAATALGVSDRGTIDVGMRADLAVWNAGEPAELSYWMGAPLCAATIAAGSVAWTDGTVG